MKTPTLILVANCLILCAFVFAHGVIGQEAVEAIVHSSSDAPGVDLGALIEEAFFANPEIQAAKAQWAQTIEKHPQETALDDPMLNFSYYVESVETRVGPQEYSVGVSQKFPFPGTLRQKERVVEKEIEISRLEYEKTARDIIVDLKQAVYEIQYMDGAIEITKQNQELLNEILSYAEAQYSNQANGINDVFRAESQLAQLDYDLITLRELRAVQQTVINSMLNRPADDPIGSIAASIPQPTTLEIAALDRLAYEQNQEILISQMKVEKAEESIRLARRMNLPGFTIGANYISTDDALNPQTPESGKDPIIVGGGVTIPLWFGKNKARIRYAKEGKTSAQQKEQSVANQIAVNLRKAYFRMENAQRLVILYRDHLIPQAEQSMQIAEEWNRNRQGSVSEVLEVQSVWLNFNLAWLRARIDYAQFFSQLERIAGGSLSPVLNLE
ncbi:MAG: TolC family protein [Candidatus Hinthialibacter antarcticus]|nr:TolC family protein [Candidatus Hinthialibacter antarcticus]